MEVLYLTLKSKWYDMIEAGIKPEEYREIKPFWIKRLMDSKRIATENLKNIVPGTTKTLFEVWRKDFTHVHFARGGHFHPSLPQMTWELKEIIVGTGKEEWGAEPGKEYFVIRLSAKCLIELQTEEAAP